MAFYIRLKKFFEKNDPDRLYMIKKIAQSFRNDEDAIMERLEEIYRKGGPSRLMSTNPPKSSFSHNVSGSSSQKYSSSDVDDSHDSINTDESSNFLKSKKKLIIKIAIVILGIVIGYFGVGMFFSADDSTDDVHNEEIHADDHSNAEENSHDTPEKEIPAVIEKEVIVVEEDTTASNIDSASIDQNVDSLSVEQDEGTESDDQEGSNNH